MGLTSLQVCMDSSDWLQGTVQEDSSGMESSPSALSPNDMLACSRPLNMERRLRPPHDQPLKCPRCESTHTKFCYYNNYSLSQPRYFCKTCRRYWTKGGTLRNIPVGGGCRKNKKPSSSKKQSDNASPVSAAEEGQGHALGSSSSNTTDLQLSFPDHVQFSHLSGLIGPHHHPNNNFLPIDIFGSKMEGIVGNSHRNGNFDIMGNSSVSGGGGADLGMVHLGSGTTNINHNLYMEHNFHPNICTPFGMSLLEGGHGGTGNNVTGGFVDTCQRMMLPYEAAGQGGIDVKPNTKALLSLDWQQEQGCSSNHHVGKDSFGYLNGAGNWSGVMNNYGSSTTNNFV